MMVWPRISLRSRILVIVAALTLLSVGGGLASLWFNYQMNKLFRSMVDQDLAALEAAEELNTALVMQKGYLTYFFLDGDPIWLSELDQRDQDFKGWLSRAHQLTSDPAERELLGRIESDYLSLAILRGRVIDYYQSGRKEEGYRLHQQVRRDYFEIRELAADYRNAHHQRIDAARRVISDRTALLSKLSLAAMAAAVFLGGLLAFVLIRQVLGPIRRLAIKADPVRVAANQLNEVQALRHGVQHLIEDVDETKTQLELSREHLIQAAKLASVGRLAAGVAHSIRNPLTSVKMRLFSLERSLQLSNTHQEDFEVISEEIRHIDSIVRNFLEFSRRPKLRLQRGSPSDIVDAALGLLEQRLQSFGVEVQIERQARLPEMEADPEQLREVLVNLIVNAGEALAAHRADSPDPGGPPGRIIVTETEASIPPFGRTVVLKVRDNGPGVSSEVQDQVFHPFFTTKDEGTGLGLSIALRIVEEHGGRLDIESEPGVGTAFIITLPLETLGRSAAAGPEKEGTSWAES